MHNKGAHYSQNNQFFILIVVVIARIIYQQNGKINTYTHTHTQDVLVTYVDEMFHRTFKVFLQSKVKNNSFILTTPPPHLFGPISFCNAAC